jgi:anti-anti-sigma factor
MDLGKIEVASRVGTYIIKLSGDVRLNLCSALENYLDDMFLDEEFTSVFIDLSDAQGVDSTTLGQLAKISIVSQSKFDLLPTIISPREDILRILESMGFDQVFKIIDKIPAQISELNELNCVPLDEEQMRKKVIAAHEILISLNEKNKSTFQDLVDNLQDKD